MAEIIREDFTVYRTYTCGMTGTRLIEDEDGKLDVWVRDHMMRAYPQGGRTKSRRN